MFLPLTSGKRCTGRKGVAATARRSSCNRARRSSKRARIVLHRFIQRRIVFYRFRTVRLFRLNGWGVSYNGKGRSVFVSFRKNGTITLYCHIPYIHVQNCGAIVRRGKHRYSHYGVAVPVTHSLGIVGLTISRIYTERQESQPINVDTESNTSCADTFSTSLSGVRSTNVPMHL